MGFSNPDGIPAPDQWKRAVLRPPPTHFLVEPLVPSKKGGSYNYGFRISPTRGGRRSSLTSSSTNTEYEIWRKWEDCLWFQDVLEMEYRRAARAKRQRLQQGKGVKKNGVYMRKDAASSWESLPPGPDPDSVARDIHEYLPKLTKKGTLFRPSQATIDQRHAELSALIEALMRPDQPALIQELMCNRLICDFFGYWQRDKDLVDKETKSKIKPGKPRGSVTSSVLSAYFSSSTTSLHDSDSGSPVSSPHRTRSPSIFSIGSQSSRSPRSPTPSSHSTGAIERSSTPSAQSTRTFASQTVSSRPSTSSGSTVRPQTADTLLAIPHTAPRVRSGSTPATPSFVGRRRAVSTTSTDSSSAQSTTSNDSLAPSTVTVVLDEVPILFGHNPHLPREDRPTSILEALPEDVIAPVKKETIATPIVKRGRKGSVGEHPHRSCQIYVEPPSSPSEPRVLDLPVDQLTPGPERSSVRESWQTTDSNSTILRDLNLTLPPDESTYRETRGSIASFMTQNSADAIMPRPAPAPIDSDKVPQDVCDSRRTTIIEDNENWDVESKIDMAIFDAFPMPTDYIPPPPESRPETPIAQLEQPRPSSVPDSLPIVKPLKPRIKIPSADQSQPKSPEVGTSNPVPQTQPMVSKAPSPSTSPPATATFSTSAIGVPPPRYDIPDIVIFKVAYNTSIISLRASREIEFSEIKKRIYNKFVGQEGVPLDKNFKVAFVLQNHTDEFGIQGHEQDDGDVQVVNGQDEWELVTYGTDSNKLMLRIMDPVPVPAAST
ncbi:hypothetical protein AX16_006731 [Volvariella volvacea WC 439]|nr:hypothetical protein AX16_006731 [Volvariella volvacea WC 439]